MELTSILEGWLTKSPPEKRSTGPFKLFKAKWRKRWFVLYEPPASQSLPGSRAALDYYNNERHTKKLGAIDLEHCEEVLCKLDTAYYKHVFSLRTKHKGRARCYYLASDSEGEMMKWVDCLCLALGLKENEDPAPTMRTIQPSPQPALRSSPIIAPQSSIQRSPLPALRGPGAAYLDIHSDGSIPPASHMQQPHAEHSLHVPNIPPKHDREGYIPLEDCVTGRKPSMSPSNGSISKQGQHRASLDSIPPEPPPAPPMKQGKLQEVVAPIDPSLYDSPARSYVNLDDNENVYKTPGNNTSIQEGYTGHSDDEGIYKMPRSEARFSSDDEGVYKIPRDFGKSQTHAFDEDDDTYKVPTLSRQQGGHRISSELYQVPPAHHPPVWAPNQPELEGYYDLPPTHAPPRPVQEGSQYSSSSASDSQHGSRAVSSYSQRPSSDIGDLYDVPKQFSQVHHAAMDYRTSSTLGRVSTQDIYDAPRTHRKTLSENNLLESVVPAPPKACADATPHQGRYENLPTNGSDVSSTRSMPRKGSHPRPPTSSTSSYQQDDTYDIPPLKHPVPIRMNDSEKLVQSPPPPRPCQPHSYINAPHDRGPATPTYPGLSSPVLAPTTIALTQNPHSAHESFYMPMSSSIELRDATQRDTTMASHMPGDVYTDMKSMNLQQDLYSVPPSNRPVNPSVHDVVPPPSKTKAFIEPKGAFDKESYPFPMQTHRTRSFKRPVPQVSADVALPTRRPVQMGGHSDSSSDEDSSSGSNHDKSGDNLSYRPSHQQHSSHGNPHLPPKLGSLNCKPPPPKNPGEVQYLDLALDEKSDVQISLPSRGPAAGSSSPTDYKEIDFVKTKALSDTKKERVNESKRKSSERSVDD